MMKFKNANFYSKLNIKIERFISNHHV